MTDFEKELLQLIRGLERRVAWLERRSREQPVEMADGDEEQLSPPWIVYYDGGEIAHGTTDVGAWHSAGYGLFNEFVNVLEHQVDEQNHLLSLSAKMRTLVGDELWVAVVDAGANATEIDHIGPVEPGTWVDLSSGAYFDARGHFVTTGEGET